MTRAVFNFSAFVTLSEFTLKIVFLLVYLVPAIPVIFWIRALLSWIYMVIGSW